VTLDKRTVMLLSIALGIALELGIHALTGRREAWDSGEYWTIGLPLVAVAAAVIGYFSSLNAWRWTALIVPGQVLAMIVRSGDAGFGLWPLMVVLSSVLSAPFLLAAFVGSRLRPRR
jgi:hypothetical protein